jgi:hypothetical protein
VCAYVRPDEVDGQDPHGAFRNNKALHDKCIAMRTALLKHQARFRVNLKDADAADPVFAQKLRDAGVNNTPAQLMQNLGKVSAGLVDDDDSQPEPPPAPAGGLPFGQLGPAEDDAWPAWKKAAAIGGGAAAVAGAAYYWIRGRHRERVG